MRAEEIVHGYVDAALNKLRRSRRMLIPDPRIPPLMQDHAIMPDLDWQGWKAVESTVSDAELDELEKQIQLSFPPSYRIFLKYKHFYDLTESGMRFEPHIIGRWKQELLVLYRGWMPERIAQIGLIPFGSEAFLDAGPVCFDTRRELEGGDYPIVFWDHEWVGTKDEVQPLFSSSLKMFEALRYIADHDTNFLYFDEEDGEDEILEKVQLLKSFLAIDPGGAGGVARSYWASLAGGAEI